MTVSDWLIKHPGVNQKHFCVSCWLTTVRQRSCCGRLFVLWGGVIVVVKFVLVTFCLYLIVNVTPILFWIFLGQFSFCFLFFCACFTCGSASELKQMDPVYCGCLAFVFLCVCRSFSLSSMLVIHTCVLCWFLYPICTSHVAYL